MSENTGTERRERNHLLDLDELLGQSRSIKVKLQGNEYPMQHIRTLSPEALAQFLHYQQVLEKERPSDDPDSLVRMSEAIDGMLGIVCPELAKMGLSFMAKMQVMAFYGEAVGEEYQLGGALKAVKPKSTGRRPSPRSATGTA